MHALARLFIRFHPLFHPASRGGKPPEIFDTANVHCWAMNRLSKLNFVWRARLEALRRMASDGSWGSAMGFAVCVLCMCVWFNGSSLWTRVF